MFPVLFAEEDCSIKRGHQVKVNKSLNFSVNMSISRSSSKYKGIVICHAVSK